MASPKVIECLFNNQPILVTLGGVWDANLIYRRKRTNSLSYFQASASGGFCGPPSLNLKLNVLYSKSWFNDFLKFLIAKFVDWNETNELKDKICRWYLLQQFPSSCGHMLPIVRKIWTFPRILSGNQMRPRARIRMLVTLSWNPGAAKQPTPQCRV